MKRCFLFGILILIFIASANAQKLIYGGKPKAAKVAGLKNSFCVNLAKQTSICKGIEISEEGDGKFFVRQNGQKKGEIGASLGVYGSSEKFFAFYGDLDKNKSAELVIVDFTVQSNGLGVSYYDINIFPDFESTGFQKPITFQTTEFGKDGTFVYDSKANETLILITDFNGLDNISLKGGTYFVGRFFRFQNGLLKPATDKPIYARRYLNSFQNERFRTEKNPLRPWLWLNTPKAEKLKIDTEFSIKPLTSEAGVVEKVEMITEKAEDGGESEEVKIEQLTIKLDSGETKKLVIWKNPSYIQLESDKQKIFADTIGILPANISLPQGLNLKIIFGKLEGKKVVVNSYQPYDFDEDKKPRYKVLFYK